MTLDEAIEHAEWCARESQGECAEEHRQLAEWLSELKRLKAQNKLLRKWYTALRESQKKAFAESCKTATNNLLKICKLNDENAELRELVRDMWRDGMCDCDEQYTCAECEYGYHERMRELGIEVKND
jgi:transposase-like protein